MKPINVCLDYLLKHLFANRFKPEGQRIPFDVDNKVMPELGLENHHEFKELINMLVEEGNAFFIDGWKDDLDEYRKRVMITPAGIDFLNKGGYKGKEIRDTAQSTRLKNLENANKNNQRWITILTVILIIIGMPAAIKECVELYWKHGWFHF